MICEHSIGMPARKPRDCSAITTAVYPAACDRTRACGRELIRADKASLLWPVNFLHNEFNELKRFYLVISQDIIDAENWSIFQLRIFFSWNRMYPCIFSHYFCKHLDSSGKSNTCMPDFCDRKVLSISLNKIWLEMNNWIPLFKVLRAVRVLPRDWTLFS